jgi:ABC-2 type transport system permease protein
MRRVGVLYLRLLRLHAPLLAATAGAALLFEVFMVWVSAQLDTGLGLRVFLEQFVPPEMQRLISEQFGVGTFQGAVAFGFQHPVFLVAVMAFVVVAASVPAGERESGFLDLVLARPVRRADYLSATVLLVVTGAVVLPAAVLTGAAVGLATVAAVPEDVAWTAYVPAAVAQGMILLAAGGIVLVSSASGRRRGPAVGRAVALLLVFYWLDFVGPFWEPLDAARWISPFTYFDPTGAVGASVQFVDVVVLLGVFAVTTAAAFVEFRRQDL